MYKGLSGMVAAIIALSISGCATASGAMPATSDPYQKLNRKLFAFNQGLDKHLLRPVAVGYDKHTPAPVKRSVSAFFANLQEPFTTVNALLQGKPAQAHDAAGRFIMNSTIGLGGLFDVATPLGLAATRSEDFDQTFGIWGISSGPYLMLPFFGPSTVRDVGNRIINGQLNPLADWHDRPRYAAWGLDVVNSRAGLLGTDTALDMQLDPYVFLRESYLQSREKEIRDGEAVQETDEFEEALFND